MPPLSDNAAEAGLGTAGRRRGMPGRKSNRNQSRNQSIKSGNTNGGDHPAVVDGQPTTLAYKGEGKPAIGDWGYPGYLTKEEVRVYEKFRDEVHQRDDAFRSTVFCFEGAREEEAYALCRWLRARKFNLRDTIQMIQEATECRSDPLKEQFFPDPYEALGVEPSIYISQYPQQYCGFARNGCPVFISKPSALNYNGIACVSTIQGILNFHWFAMMHDFVDRLRQGMELHPSFKRYELLYVMDLGGLTTSQLQKRILNIVKIQSKIDSICFPETLYRLVIINAPSFFAMTWKIIKNWVDVRTSNKVEIISNRSKWEKRLRELVDEQTLPSDYGGKGLPSAETFKRYCQAIEEFPKTEGEKGAGERNNDNNHVDRERIIRRDAHLLSVRTSTTQTFTISTGEHMQICVFTRSVHGGKLSVFSPDGRMLTPSGVNVKHKGIGNDEENPPTRFHWDGVLKKAGTYSVKLESNAGRFSSENFLVVGIVSHAEDSTLTDMICAPSDSPAAVPLCCDDIIKPDFEDNAVDETVHEEEKKETSGEGSMEDVSLASPPATKKTVNDDAFGTIPFVDTSADAEQVAPSTTPHNLAKAKLDANTTDQSTRLQIGSTKGVVAQSCANAETSTPEHTPGLLCNAFSLSSFIEVLCAPKSR